MRVIGAAGAAAVALLLGGSAGAASFDCARAGTRTEKMICADKALSALDSELALAFRDAVQLSPTPARLTAEQRNWLRGRDEHAEPRYVEDLYRGRLQELNALRRRDGRARWHSRAQLATQCVYLLIEGVCSVAESGPIDGFSPPLFFQAQRTPDDPSDGWSGLVIFEQADGDRLQPIVWDGGEGGIVYERPELVRSVAGPLLVIKAEHLGTGHFNADIVMRRVGGRWRDVDTESWKRELARRLPDGRYIAKGVGYDFEALTAGSWVWTETDANCCPSGGYVTAHLALEGDRLVFKRMDYDPNEVMS